MKVVTLNLSSLAFHYWVGKSHFCRAPESHRILGGDHTRARQEEVYYADLNAFINNFWLFVAF